MPMPGPTLEMSMNPMKRKLRLRTTTVQRLNPDTASRVRGGTIDFDDDSGMWPICSLIKCPSTGCPTIPDPEPDPDPRTAAYTNCPDCPSYHLDCCTDDPQWVSCYTEPHVGCCNCD